MNSKVKDHHVPHAIDTVLEADAPTEHGTPFGGGFYAGRIRKDGVEHIIIKAPKAIGETKGVWGEYGVEIDATSFYDGMKNTVAMAAAGSAIAAWALGLTIGGYAWHIPSRDELEVCYRNLKPTTETNVRYSGDNPSNGSYPYTPINPAQVKNPDFQEGGSEAIEATWHWSSTQFSAHHSWFQGFGNGNVTSFGKSEALCAFAVRTIQVI